MKSKKTLKTIFWITTIMIFLFEGVMPALTSQTEMAKESLRHLGYPEYFGFWLMIFKVIGAIILIVPPIPKCMKEWAYAGFTFDFIWATISLIHVDGLVINSILIPFVALVVLMTSYYTYHKLQPCCLSKE